MIKINYPVRQLVGERSASFNHHSDYAPANAHDGNYDTHYSVKDGAVAGNFLKLYLEQAYSIGEVKMISMPGNEYTMRMVNAEVRVYTKEVEVASCGKITG